MIKATISHLSNVENVAKLSEVGRHELSAAKGEEFVVLLKRIHQPQGCKEGTQLWYHSSLPSNIDPQ